MGEIQTYTTGKIVDQTYLVAYRYIFKYNCISPHDEHGHNRYFKCSSTKSTRITQKPKPTKHRGNCAKSSDVGDGCREGEKEGELWCKKGCAWAAGAFLSFPPSHTTRTVPIPS